MKNKDKTFIFSKDKKSFVIVLEECITIISDESIKTYDDKGDLVSVAGKLEDGF